MISHMELRCSDCNHILKNCMCDEYDKLEKVDFQHLEYENIEDDIKKRKL